MTTFVHICKISRHLQSIPERYAKIKVTLIGVEVNNELLFMVLTGVMHSRAIWNKPCEVRVMKITGKKLGFHPLIHLKEPHMYYIFCAIRTHGLLSLNMKSQNVAYRIRKWVIVKFTLLKWQKLKIVSSELIRRLVCDRKNVIDQLFLLCRSFTIIEVMSIDLVPNNNL